MEDFPLVALKTILLAATIIGGAIPQFASACTRTLFVGDDNTVITGRNMDWSEDMATNLWIFPAGIARDGVAGPQSISWKSRYGSVIASGYDVGSADGMNEKGLVGNLLYLAESQYGKPAAGRPVLSISLWLQYALDNFATVAEAVDALALEPFDIISPTLPNGQAASLHLAISDSTGDSAIFEYIDGKLKIHHGSQYKVMTNSPSYDQQLAINTYWKGIGGLTFLPGTNRAADRFARASFLLSAIPTRTDPNYIRGVPQRSFDYQAVAEVMSVQRAVGVPLGITTPNAPNISSTIWRTVADQKNLVYYFDSATRPNTFWVSLSKLDFKPGAPVKKLTIADGEVFSGETAGKFEAAESFKFLPANPQ
jgi:choloylglycine hydrolase